MICAALSSNKHNTLEARDVVGNIPIEKRNLCTSRAEILGLEIEKIKILERHLRTKKY